MAKFERPNGRTGRFIPCAICGTPKWVNPFREKTYSTFFCSRKCKGVWNTIYRIGKDHPRWNQVETKCDGCGKEISLPQWENRRTARHYCSKKCADTDTGKRQTGADHPLWSQKEIPCSQCGKSFPLPKWHREQPGNKFCSKACNSQWKSDHMRGSNHPLWKGGTSNHPYPIDWEEIAERVRVRDHHTCQNCGKSGKQVHHIDSDRTNNEDSNLITLCRICHGQAKNLTFDLTRKLICTTHDWEVECKDEPGKNYQCKTCGKIIYRPDYKAKWNKKFFYCSQECHHNRPVIHWKGEWRTCQECGKLFWNMKCLDQKYCSRECWKVSVKTAA